jgi:hypothetical protein
MRADRSSLGSFGEDGVQGLWKFGDGTRQRLWGFNELASWSPEILASGVVGKRGNNRGLF